MYSLYLYHLENENAHTLFLGPRNYIYWLRGLGFLTKDIQETTIDLSIDPDSPHGNRLNFFCSNSSEGKLTFFGGGPPMGRGGVLASFVKICLHMQWYDGHFVHVPLIKLHTYGQPAVCETASYLRSHLTSHFHDNQAIALHITQSSKAFPSECTSTTVRCKRKILRHPIQCILLLNILHVLLIS